MTCALDFWKKGYPRVRTQERLACLEALQTGLVIEQVTNDLFTVFVPGWLVSDTGSSMCATRRERTLAYIRERPCITFPGMFKWLL